MKTAFVTWHCRAQPGARGRDEDGGAKTETTYRRYAIGDEETLREAAKPQTLHDLQGVAAWTSRVTDALPRKTLQPTALGPGSVRVAHLG